MVTSCKVVVQHHSQSVDADTVSTQGSSFPSCWPFIATATRTHSPLPTSASLLLATANLFSIPIILLFEECHMNGITHYCNLLGLAFFIQHNSLEILPGCCKYPYMRGSFLLLSGVPWCVGTPRGCTSFICSFLCGGYLGCFWLFWIKLLEIKLLWTLVYWLLWIYVFSLLG